jgi:TRAP-type C4-dicarboxylate transport system permease small subunit
MTRLHTFCVRVLNALTVTTFLTLVVDVLWGVATRYLLGGQAPWTEELARLLLIWLAMLGTALAYASHNHLGVDVLVNALAHPARRIAGLATHLVVFFFASTVMTFGGVSLLLDRWRAGQVMSTLPVPQAWMYAAIPVSGFLMCFFAVAAMVPLARGDAGVTADGESA